MIIRFRLQIIFLLVLLWAMGLSGFGQNKSNRGKEFWLGYSFSANFFPHAGLSDPVNAQEMTLYISTSSQPANVTVSINGTSWTQTLTIPANTADASIIIPKAGADDARILSDGLSNKAIHVVSDVPVAVYSHEYDAMYSAATMLMPSETWGYIYYSVNYYQTKGFSNPPFVDSSRAVNFPDWYNWFYIVAKDDNTRVLITPSDTCKNGWLPGQTYTVNLNKGEIYTVFGKANFAAGWFTDTVNSSKDLTGSKILSVAGGDGNCHPVALFSGTGGMHVCQRDGGEAVQQQVFPAQAWGTRYLTHHTISNFSGDINATFRNYYRVCVKDPTTVVKRNGVVMTGLIRNFFYQFLDSTGGDYFETDKPILVSQYTPNRAQCWQTILPAQTAIGDPEMFYLSPIEQGQKSVIFYTSSHNLISKSYVNIIIPTAGISSLLLDGAAIPAAQIKIHPNNPAYSVAIGNLSSSMDMQHTMTSDSAFTATVYGLGAYESYGYNIGCNVNNLNMKSEFKNVFTLSAQADTITCPKTPFRIFAKVGYPLTKIQWKLSQVPGIVPNVDSIISNPVPINTEMINGRNYYVYTLQQDFTLPAPGTFQIPVSYTHPDVDACNNTETENIVVLVRPGPVADFTIPSACPNQSIVLTGTSANNGFNIASYLWNFPDATTQTTVNATKTFPAVGSYNVRYRIYAGNGCAGDTTKVVSIGSPLTLTVQATGKACADSAFIFTSSIPTSTTNPPGWYWNFGDGNSTTITNSNTVIHNYTASATTRTVRHAVSFTTGCSTDTALYSIPVIHSNPAASFSFITDTLCEKIPVRFISTAGGVSSWFWNFGNGTSNTAPPFYHTYNTAGTFNVSLVITDTNGCGSLPAINQVIINQSPAINAGPDKVIKPGSSITLDATITNPGNYDFLWTPAAFLNFTTVLNPVAAPDRKITYTIRAIDKLTHCVAKDSVVVTPITAIYIPTAFTPDNNGKNDVFKILGTDVVTQFNVIIFNRYGQVVFESSDKSKGWDGIVNGKPSSPGGYVYIVKYKAPNFPDVQVEKGSFVLLR